MMIHTYYQPNRRLEFFNRIRPSPPFGPEKGIPNSCHSFSKAVGVAVAGDAPIWRNRLDGEQLSGEDILMRGISWPTHQHHATFIC